MRKEVLKQQTILKTVVPEPLDSASSSSHEKPFLTRGLQPLMQLDPENLTPNNYVTPQANTFLKERPFDRLSKPKVPLSKERSLSKENNILLEIKNEKIPLSSYDSNSRKNSIPAISTENDQKLTKPRNSPLVEKENMYVDLLAKIRHENNILKHEIQTYIGHEKRRGST